MKRIIGMIMIASLAIAVPAQTAQGQAAAAADAAKVLAKYTAMNTGAMKNSPFTADEVNESVQVLGDGNRIVRNSTGKMYRNSDGRVRRDMKGGTGGLLGSTFTFNDLTAFKPDFGQSYFFDTPTLPALPPLPAMPALALTPDAPSPRAFEEAESAMSKARVEVAKSREESAKVRDKMAKARVEVDRVRTELQSIKPAPFPAFSGMYGGQVIAPSGVIASSGFQVAGACPLTAANSKSQCRTEHLGNQNIEGVDAEGTRTITTIEAGAIGNDRPIEIVYERWFSKEIGVVVASKRNDPRFGEQTYRLTNIVRAEPDPSLFTLPHKVSGAGAPGQNYRTISTKPDAARPAQSVGTSRAKP